MRNAGIGLVWSPHSNVELYGSTANLNAALDAGVQIALAPDWAITGSSNMLDELHYASLWNDQHLAGRLTAQQLVEMVTVNAAQIGGIEDEVGSIRPGLRADLLVIEGDHNDPYHALMGATAADVQLVLINGVAVLGASHYMLQFWPAEELETIEIDGTIKMIHMPVEGQTFASVVARLQTALASQGISLAPITEK
jgi:5-methylthioadenosine/S-adenosylhomocysteine deaminase